MRILCATLLIGVISECASRSIEDLLARGTSIIPSAPAWPTPTPRPQEFRKDPSKQSKNVHDFFRAYGWLRRNETIPDAKLPAAIRKIQRILREKPTGVYDDRLDSVMSRPRCGTVQPYNATDAQQDGDIHRRYVLWGPKWDHSAITYRFVNYTADLTADRQRSIVRFVYLHYLPRRSSFCSPCAVLEVELEVTKTRNIVV